MSTTEPFFVASYPLPPPHVDVRPDAHKVGMLAFFMSETAFFSTLLMAYVIYMGASLTGPTPAQVLSLPLAIVNTICLLTSSFTIHLAEKSLRSGNSAAFRGLWGLTILLGAAFVAGTGYEWYGLIVEHQLTIGRNLFGTTYYTLVGFHAAHVTVGVILLVLMLGLYQRRKLTGPNPIGIELVSWYWHFVDGVWIVVFTVVYVIGR
ncbi:MAG TPA: heme-copper oxidase subunit III [Gemmataceae bacterium]|nr:heme-copper oxidase subunit III [Gemmataceae bacterium]